MIPFDLPSTSAIIGDTPKIREIKAYALKVAGSDSNVLITGETGTGKEQVAKVIHSNSKRCNRPLICINSAALPDGLLESELFGYEKGAFTGACTRFEGKLKQADGGTAFFDEIGDMTPYCQAKILRAIESGQVHPLGGRSQVSVDLRVIAATNQDLAPLMSENRFRKDLYFRLNVVHIHLPALRDRKQDIPLLVSHYLEEYSRCCGCNIPTVSPEALALLMHYEWPGNVRELRNLIEAIFIDPPSVISTKDIPEHIRERFPAENDFHPTEQDRLIAALLAANWNKSKAAEQLHWSRMTLYRKMQKYQIQNSTDHPDDHSSSTDSL